MQKRRKVKTNQDWCDPLPKIRRIKLSKEKSKKMHRTTHAQLEFWMHRIEFDWSSDRQLNFSQILLRLQAILIETGCLRGCVCRWAVVIGRLVRQSDWKAVHAIVTVMFDVLCAFGVQLMSGCDWILLFKLTDPTTTITAIKPPKLSQLWNANKYKNKTEFRLSNGGKAVKSATNLVNRLNIRF